MHRKITLATFCLRPANRKVPKILNSQFSSPCLMLRHVRASTGLEGQKGGLLHSLPNRSAWRSLQPSNFPEDRPQISCDNDTRKPIQYQALGATAVTSRWRTEGEPRIWYRSPHRPPLTPYQYQWKTRGSFQLRIVDDYPVSTSQLHFLHSFFMSGDSKLDLKIDSPLGKNVTCSDGTTD